MNVAQLLTDMFQTLLIQKRTQLPNDYGPLLRVRQDHVGVGTFKHQDET